MTRHYCEEEKCWYCFEQFRKQPSYILETSEQALFKLAKRMTESPAIMKLWQEALNSDKHNESCGNDCLIS